MKETIKNIITYLKAILFRLFLVSSISCRATQTPKNAPKPTLPVAHQPAGSRCGRAGLPERFRPAVIAISLFLLLTFPAFSQRYAIKTNALYLATATPNIGLEIALDRISTINLGVACNPWNANGSGIDYSKLVHLRLEPEYRYWLWERFNGHYFGVNALYASYNISGRTIPFLFDSEHQYKGTGYGIGVSYGFHLMISTAFGIEAYMGAGVTRLSFDKSQCMQCDPLPEHISETYIGPTKIGLSLIYLLK